jgi:hypothetical protein
VPVALLGRDRDRRVAVAHRVLEQVHEYPLEHEPVGDDGEVGCDVELDRRPLGHRRRGDLGERAPQHERPRVDLDRLRVEPREVEQLLEQPTQADPLLVADADQLAPCLLRQLVTAGVEGREDAVHRGRRRPQLVRGDGDEVQLQLVELDDLLVQARALDRERDPLGDELEQVDVVPGEDAPRQRPDVHDADHLVACDQRHAQHRDDLLLQQDRVPDAVGPDVLDHDRLPRRGDAAREAGADRDVDADLLLDPERGPRDQVLALVVEQQHRARVGAEDGADPRQQLLEQVFQLEVRERRVRHLLDVLELPADVPLRLVQARVLDRDRGAVGGELQHLDVLVPEGAPGERADVEHADDAVADDERHAEHRPDPLLAQDRVHHVGVVDVVEDHGLPGRGDPACEAAPDRDAHALLDLLLDPDRRACDQLLRVLVEQEDGARVDLEHVAHAQQQRPEQLVELEVRQRGVRQLLEPTQPLRVYETLVVHRRPFCTPGGFLACVGYGPRRWNRCGSTSGSGPRASSRRAASPPRRCSAATSTSATDA